ncbi:hypothetical protein GCM10027273_18650 [Nocardioides pakistanensis]
MPARVAISRIDAPLNPRSLKTFSDAEKIAASFGRRPPRAPDRPLAWPSRAAGRVTAGG